MLISFSFSFSFSFSLFFFFILFGSSSSFNATHKCFPQQGLDLLLFKDSMYSINYSYDDYNCQSWLGSDYHPIMMNWNKNMDCCKWDGVTCNHKTGDVIGLDLSCGMLQGTIDPYTTLFHLLHLQTLNLAYNDFSYSQLPREVGRLSNSLTHLNLSQCSLTGDVSVEILFLPKLVSLDLSWNYELQIKPNVLKNLLQNHTHLEELMLSEVVIGWVLPTNLNLSSSLKSLHLSSTRLQGKLPDNFFSLPYLEKIDLSLNYGITGPFPKANTTNKIPLKWLDLSSTNLLGEMIPDSIGNLKSLNYLSLYSCGLVGSLPKSLVNLRHLATLYLSNNKLNGTLSSFLFTLPLIENIFLGSNLFSGGLPSEFFNCQSLKQLTLQRNQFDGKINRGSTPPSFILLTNLSHLDLSFNNFTGLWDLDTLLASLPNLEHLDLSYSGLTVVNVNNNRTSNVNPEFLYLGLASCKLPVFPESLRAMKILTQLDLSDNDIHGRIPDWAGEIGGNQLYYLNLSNNFITGLPQVQWDGLKKLLLQSNLLQGAFPISICRMRYLESLDISNNRFSGMIPRCFRNTSSPLQTMNINSNQLQGPFPSSICNLSSLSYLDMSNNSFIGMIPRCLGNTRSILQYLNVKSNQLQGPFPSSICNLRLLTLLDMSNNNFVGTIPQCFGNISSFLRIVDLGNNRFHGIIPNVYEECEQLEGLILKGNRLKGEVPRSLSKCQSLKVLDLGNNQLNGTFPQWSGDFPVLQVLILRSNKLHGPIEISSTYRSAFPSMQVLDLSHNGFVGHLPQKYFENFNAMKNVVKKSTPPEYLDLGYHQYYSIIIAVKGVEQPFPKLFIGYTIVDLSNNIFEGQIPGVIGGLASLKVLNISHNILTGHIPYALGNLSEIESLDLSWNQLTGEIPQSLADITTLEVLNLSQNSLVGRIPSGPQFNTFSTSFEGNPKLCGFPLPKKCEIPHEQQPEVDGDGDGDEESGFTWRVVVVGYGCGTVIGLVMGYLMLSTGRPKWFNEIADAGDHIIRTRGSKRRYIYIGK